jgi:hypothetical protein
VILEAAAALGVDAQEIKDVEEWEGPDRENSGDGMEGLEQEVPIPHKVIYEIYQKATPHLAQLQKLPKSKAAPKALDSVNEEIKKLNQKDGVDPLDQWVIRYQEFAEIYQKARPAIDRVRKDPNDSEAKKELEEHSKALAEIIRRNHYLNWNINLDIEGPENPQARARRGKSPGPADSTSKPPEQAPRPRPTDSTSKPPEQAPAPEPARDGSQPTESSDGQGPQVSAQEAPARSQAAREIQLKTLELWAHMGWSTHKMSDGDIILSHKPLSRLGQEPYAFEFTVMTQDSPYFQIKLGSEVGRQEMDAYFALSQIYKINTDPGNEDTPVYTWRDKPNYSKLLWTATKQRKQTQAGRNPRAGDTQACVLWKDGTVSEMSRAHFKKVTTENEVKAIETYCKYVDIRAPWEMEPKTLTVPANSALGQQLLQAGRTGSAINLNTTAPVIATSNPENPGAVSSSLQSSFTAFQTSLQVIDSKFEKSLKMMQEQQKKQQDLLMQMQRQLQQQQEQQMDLQNKLLLLLTQLSTASSQGSTSN